MSRAGIGSGTGRPTASGMDSDHPCGPEVLVKPEYQEHIDALIQEEKEGGYLQGRDLLDRELEDNDEVMIGSCCFRTLNILMW
jgi:hypothetical protein